LSSGYEQIYLDLLPELLKCDLAESAGRLGLQVLADGAVWADYLGREYRITSTGVKPVDGQPVDINNCSVLVHYILSKGCGEMERSYLPLTRINRMKIDGQKTLGHGLMIDPLVQEFGSDYEKFQAAALKLNGVLEAASQDGGHIWDFQVLPKIPLRVVYYEADDEFPVNIQILFDRSAPRFMGFECLAFLNGGFTHALVTASREASASDK